MPPKFSRGSFFRREPRLCPNVAQWVEKNGAGRVDWLSEERQEHLPLPRTAGDLDPLFADHQTLTVPARYLATVPDVEIRGKDGMLVLPDGSRCIETCLPRLALAERSFWRRRARFCRGNCFSLLSSHCREFYHWMNQVLPRLHRVVDRLPAEVRFIVPGDLRDYQRETLRRLGVPDERLLFFDRKRPLRVETLWFAPFAAPQPWVERDSIDWVSKQLAPSSSIGSAGKVRLYVSRRKAAARRLVNEEELLPLLAGRGFEPVVLEDLPLEKQLDLFRRAEVVAGCHGAGFANLAFTPPGATLIEIFPTSVDRRIHYWPLAAARGIDYWYVCGDSVATGGRTPDIFLPKERLEAVLTAAGC